MAKAKAHIYCFCVIILLFKSVQRWRAVWKSPNLSCLLYGWSLSKVYVWTWHYALYWNWNLVFMIFLIQYFTKNLIYFIYFIFRVCPVRSFYYSWNYNLIMLLYKRNISFILSFQPNFNIETIWFIDVESTCFYQRCFVNVETTSINVRQLNFHFQANINVETTSMYLDDQRCFDVDSTLMCLLGGASRSK